MWRSISFPPAPALAGLLCIGLWACGGDGKKTTQPEPDPRAPAATRAFSHGLLTMNVRNTGAGRTGSQGSSDGIAIHSNGRSLYYDLGLWVGAKVGGEVRVTAGSFYDHEGDALAIDDTHPCLVYLVEPGDQAGIADFDLWPSSIGAPVDGLGHPRLYGNGSAWTAYGDDDASLHTVFGSSPLQAEVRHTVWGAASSSLDLTGTLFVRVDVTNRSSYPWTDAFLGVWADPDLGQPDNDMVGCDAVAGLGYAYTFHEIPEPTFGGKQPASGIRLLKLPAGSQFYAFPRMYESSNVPANAAEAYRLLSGLNVDGTALIDSTHFHETKYWASGDPIGNTGTREHWPGDRRFLMSVGALGVAPNETVSLTYAVLFVTDPEPRPALSKLFSLSRDVRNDPTLWDLP